MSPIDPAAHHGRVMLVSLLDPNGDAGGRAMLYRMNLAILTDLFGENLLLFRPPAETRPNIPGIVRGYVDGISESSIAAIAQRIEQERVTHLFLDGSNLGAVAKGVRARFPDVAITTFFHNVETRFFWGAFRARPSPRALAVLAANHVAERAAVRASDTLITLSERDGNMLRRLLGRPADAIVPLALADGLPPGPPPGRRPGNGYALFVGGGFYANLDGIAWFASEVARRLSIETRIVGRGLEPLAEKLAGNEAVTLVGAVDELAPWYRDATLVVAPIFDGSGMKTKVAEAMMFGKPVIGTTEAFSGYDPSVVAANRVADDADAFVEAIEDIVASDPPVFDPALRALYERFHSSAAARVGMARAIAGSQPPAATRA